MLHSRFFMAFSIVAAVGCGALDAGDGSRPAAHPNCLGDIFTVTGRSARTGECLDTTVFRAVKPIEGAALTRVTNAYGIRLDSSREILVANFRHNKKFWIAKIPVSPGPTSAIFQVEEFRIDFSNPQKSIDQIPDRAQRAKAQKAFDQFKATMNSNAVLKKQYEQAVASKSYTAAHGQVRLKFSSAVELYEQKSDLAPNPARKSLNEIILSFHGVAPGTRPGEYDPVKGFLGEYGSAMGMFSLSEKYDFSIRSNPGGANTIRQYALNSNTATPERLGKTLREWARRAPGVFQTQPYDLLQRNCGSEIFNVFESVGLVSPAIREGADKAGVVLGRQYPKYALNALVARSLVSLKAGQAADGNGFVQANQVASPMATFNDECKNTPARCSAN